MLLQRPEITLRLVVIVCGLGGGCACAVSAWFGAGPLTAFLVGVGVAVGAFAVLVIGDVAAVRDKYKL